MAGLNDYTVTKINQATSGGLLSEPSDAITIFPQGIHDSEGLQPSLGRRMEFPFKFVGNEYNHYVVSPSGWVLLDGPSFDPYIYDSVSSNLPWSTSDRLLVFPWWSSLRTYNGVKTWLVDEGTILKRVVQWDVTSNGDHRAVVFGDPADHYERIVFQAVFYSVPSRIEFRYGDETIVGTTTTPADRWGASCGIRLVGSSEADGDYRDFFGASGTPTGSASPFSAELMTTTGAAANTTTVDYPGDPSNTVGYAYDIEFNQTGAIANPTLFPNDNYYQSKFLKVKLVLDDNESAQAASTSAVSTAPGSGY